MQDFMTPPKHVNFHAKKLFGEMGRIVDGSVAYIELNGGGPTEYTLTSTTTSSSSPRARPASS